MKKFFLGLVVVLGLAVAVVCTLDIGTEWIANKGAQYVADTDNDGEITVLDATWIQRHLVELDAPAAIGSTVLVAK